MPFIKIGHIYLDVTGAIDGSTSVTLLSHGVSHEFSGPLAGPLRQWLRESSGAVDILAVGGEIQTSVVANSSVLPFVPRPPSLDLVSPRPSPGLPRLDADKIRAAIRGRGKGPVDLLPNES